MNLQMLPYPHARFPATLSTALLLLWLSWNGCSEKDTTSSSGTWTISGKTAFVGAVNVVSGVTIKCGGQTTTSAADGSYELRGVPEGNQTITAEGLNCKSYSRTIEVKSNIRHFIYLDFNGTTVSGYVSNFMDGPIQGALVTIGALSDRSDEGGHYAITDVPLKSDSLLVTHPRYFSTSLSIAPTGPDTRIDATLQRDTVISGRISADQNVDEAMPSTSFYNQSRLMIASNGYIGPVYYQNVRRYIYLNFDYPAYMKDSRVTLLDGSLELCTDGAYGGMQCDAYTVSSPWIYYSLTFNQQPTISYAVESRYLPGSTGVGYVTILAVGALQQLLADYRKSGTSYGVVLQAATSGYLVSRSFYSSRWVNNRPRVSFKVRF